MLTSRFRSVLINAGVLCVYDAC